MASIMAIRPLRDRAVAGATWTRRAGTLLWAAGALAAAAWTLDFSLRSAVREDEAPAFAAIYADDGLVRLVRVLRGLGEEQAYQVDRDDALAIRDSMGGHPLNAKALAVWGLSQASEQKAEQAALPLMTLADKVTRREPISQVWLIEAASAAGDVPGAIRHYNAALSTNPPLQASLLPVLVAALDFPDVQQALRPYVRTAPWMPAYLAMAATSARTDSVLALVAGAGKDLSAEAFAPVQAILIRRLAAEGRADAALAHARAVWPDYDRKAFARFAVTPATLDKRLGTLAWALADSEGIGAALEDGAVVATLEPLGRGAVLARDVAVQAGATYQLIQTVGVDSGPRPTSLRWRASCVPADPSQPATEFWSQLVPVTSTATTYRTALTVPTGCGLAHLELVAFGPEGQIATTLRLSGLDLRRD